MNGPCIYPIIVTLTAFFLSHPLLAQTDANLEKDLIGMWELVDAWYGGENGTQKIGTYLVMGFRSDGHFLIGHSEIDMDTLELIYGVKTSGTWSVRDGQIITRVLRTSSQENVPVGEVERTKVAEITPSLLRLEPPEDLPDSFDARTADFERVDEDTEIQGSAKSDFERTILPRMRALLAN